MEMLKCQKEKKFINYIKILWSYTMSKNVSLNHLERIIVRKWTMFLKRSEDTMIHYNWR